VSPPGTLKLAKDGGEKESLLSTYRTVVVLNKYFIRRNQSRIPTNSKYYFNLIYNYSPAILADPFLGVRGKKSDEIFVAGDVCQWPDHRTGEDCRIEHWNVAVEQGKLAAKNMLVKAQQGFGSHEYVDAANKEIQAEYSTDLAKIQNIGANSMTTSGNKALTNIDGVDHRTEFDPTLDTNSLLRKKLELSPYTQIPYFWSRFFDKTLKFVGNIETFQHAVLEGEISSMKFVCYYVNKNDEITGIVSCGKEPLTAAVAELMRLGKMPKASELMMGMVCMLN
jgi:hypothetical protein